MFCRKKKQVKRKKGGENEKTQDYMFLFQILFC